MGLTIGTEIAFEKHPQRRQLLATSPNLVGILGMLAVYKDQMNWIKYGEKQTVDDFEDKLKISLGGCGLGMTARTDIKARVMPSWGSKSRMHPVLGLEHHGLACTSWYNAVAVRSVFHLYYGMDLSGFKIKPCRKADVRPVCLVRLGGHLIMEDKNEGGRQMAAMERTVGLPAKLL